MSSRIETCSFDSAAPAETARFWAAALGWEVVDDDDPDEAGVRRPERAPEAGVQPELVFLRVPETKTVKNLLHLDLRPDDQAAEVARLEALGATRVDIGQGDDVTWVAMADPEGNEFCVLQTPDPIPA